MSAENKLQLVRFIKLYDLYIVSVMLSDKDRTANVVHVQYFILFLFNLRVFMF